MSQGLDGNSAVDSAVSFSFSLSVPVGLDGSRLGRGTFLGGLLLAHFGQIVDCLSVDVSVFACARKSVDMRCDATRARVGMGRVRDVREIGNPREMLPGPDKLAFGVPV